jgi:hypothetical protein
MKTNEQFMKWLNANMSECNVDIHWIAGETNISFGALHSWSTGKNLPKLPALITLCSVFSERQNRNPKDILLTALKTIEEWNDAQRKWNNKQQRSRYKTNRVL